MHAYIQLKIKNFQPELGHSINLLKQAGVVPHSKNTNLYPYCAFPIVTLHSRDTILTVLL